ncbi:MAG: DUF1501 domain-containing protein [Bryobacterales bacterium]|nr:DUF1501 domain-containing protein [Bryobacterales bacterium]
MFRLDADKTVKFCDGTRRRDFLHVGSLSLLGLGMSEFLQMRARAAVTDTGKDINVIMLMLVGGPSQLDTFDMKPEAPIEIRGPHNPIKTNVPGIEICEIFPRMARHADKYALLRGCYHSAAALHAVGHQLFQTGRLSLSGMEHPHIGSVLGYIKGANGDLPPHVVLPKIIGRTGGNLKPGQTAGYLGKGHDPFVLNADPSVADFRVPDMLPPDYLSALRVDRRRDWRSMVDRSVSKFETSQDARLLDSTFHQAYTLMTSEKAREAFDLHREDEDTRNRYGRNRFGQSCLLARRLVESGVRFVTVNMFETVFDEITWDIHGSPPFSPISGYRDLVGPMFDNGFTSLIEDLSNRGMLESTMVLALGEFGRTPKVNPAGGRDHWPQSWTVVGSGGGIQGGQVIGSTDKIGGAPKDRPVHPSEIVATIYHRLGIPLETELPAANGRPLPVVDRGVEPVHELFS